MPIKTTLLLPFSLSLGLSLGLIPAAAMAAPAGASPAAGATQQATAGRQVVAQAGARTSAKAAPTFVRGDVLPEAYRKKAVKNPYHFGLSQPGRNQQWVQVGRTFYLIERDSGTIADRVDV